ncbi:MAG: GDP-mannose 4,6-dehydratase [Acidobacteriota bacterium]
MRYFLTGITGFIGRRLAQSLSLDGHRVFGTFLGPEMPPEVEAATQGKLWEADLLDSAALEAALRLSEPEVLVHLGGLSHVGASWGRMAEYFQVNVLGTESLLRSLRRVSAEAGVEMPRVVMASSAEVYGLVAESDQPVSEGQMVAPRTPYALTKAAAERVALAAGAVIVRSFNILGPGQASNFALPSFAAQLAAIAAGEAPPRLAVGNLEARRDFIHLDDAVAAYRRVCEAGEPGSIYNLASSCDRHVSELLDHLLQVSGLEVEIVEDPERMRPVDVPSLCGDASRLQALGWEPQRTPEQAVEALWTSLRNAPYCSSTSPEPGDAGDD